MQMVYNDASVDDLVRLLKLYPDKQTVLKLSQEGQCPPTPDSIEHPKFTLRILNSGTPSLEPTVCSRISKQALQDERPRSLLEELKEVTSTLQEEAKEAVSPTAAGEPAAAGRSRRLAKQRFGVDVF